MGTDNDKALSTAFRYLDFLGTSKLSAEQIKSEFYKLACKFNVSASTERSYVLVSGLSENFEKALELFEDILSDAQTDATIYKNLINDIFKERNNNKLDQTTNFSRLENYAIYGALSPMTNILSKKELETLNPEELVNRTKNLKNFEHKILYYGPLSEKEIVEIINNKHFTADNLQPVPEAVKFEFQDITENTVLLAEYDAKQIYMSLLHKSNVFDKNIEPNRILYNEYFGGNMSSITFQEMREARGLAYTARATYQKPAKPMYPYYMRAYIATQNDKMIEAIEAFNEILNNMPLSQNTLDIAKENLITGIRTERILREDILWQYLDDTEFGFTTDSRKNIFDNVNNLSLDDVKAFQEKYVKNKPFIYCILGDSKNLDLKELQKIGKIRKLTKEEIFGY